MVRKASIAVVIVYVLAGVALAAEADVPQLLNYQGKLTEPGGAAYSGPVDLGFGFFWAPVGDEPIFYEEQNGVVVSNGIFHVLIGDGVDQIGTLQVVTMAETVYLEITVKPGTGQAEVLSPRQRIGSALFAIKAGDANTLGGAPFWEYAPSAHNHDDRYHTKAYVTGELHAMENRIEELENALAGVTQLLQYVSVQGNTVLFSGANVQIINGTGTTDATLNGVGNLIVGYNETRGGGDVRTGSHNIIVGREHNYSHCGGLVAGRKNASLNYYACVTGGRESDATGQYASVSGGFGNVASGTSSSVAGGSTNEASGGTATVSGGYDNHAVASSSSISGGRDNETTGAYSCVSGGTDNRASGMYASVMGGAYNEASGESASVSGGQSNTATDTCASISGGEHNWASRPSASVSGGYLNTAHAEYASVTGGHDNQATGMYASVTGGTHNWASGESASVSGGRRNTASGDWSSVVGGGGDPSMRGNEAFGHYAAILGGRSNVAGDPDLIDHTLGQQSTVSGGNQNTASGESASVSGGKDNVASSYWASVSGGELNTASSYAASVSGGHENTAASSFASVSGGGGHAAIGPYDWRAGSLFENY